MGKGTLNVLVQEEGARRLRCGVPAGSGVQSGQTTEESWVTTKSGVCSASWAPVCNAGSGSCVSHGRAGGARVVELGESET